MLRTSQSYFTMIYFSDLPCTLPAFQEYSVLSTVECSRILKNEEKLPWSVYVGVAGMPGMYRVHDITRAIYLTRPSGQTAYSGWKEYASPQKGDIVFVSAGAGKPIHDMPEYFSSVDYARF